jgi:hypothetical protein
MAAKEIISHESTPNLVPGGPLSAMDPVKSSTPANLLATASVLRFRATTRDRSGSTLGVLVDAAGAQQHLTISADGGFALSPEPPHGQKAALLYESAANVLRGGALSPDGSISYEGGSYRIEPSFNGKEWTAKVSARP